MENNYKRKGCEINEWFSHLYLEKSHRFSPAPCEQQSLYQSCFYFHMELSQYRSFFTSLCFLCLQQVNIINTL